MSHGADRLLKRRASTILYVARERGIEITPESTLRLVVDRYDTLKDQECGILVRAILDAAGTETSGAAPPTVQLETSATEPVEEEEESATPAMELSGDDVKRLGARFFAENPDATSREAWDFIVTRGRPTIKYTTWRGPYATEARVIARRNGLAPARESEPAGTPAPDPGPALEVVKQAEPPDAGAGAGAPFDDAPEPTVPSDYPEAIDTTMDLIASANQRGRATYISDAIPIVASARAMIRAALPDVEQDPIYVLLRGADALLARIAEVAE